MANTGFLNDLDIELIPSSSIPSGGGVLNPVWNQHAAPWDGQPSHIPSPQESHSDVQIPQVASCPSAWRQGSRGGFEARLQTQTCITQGDSWASHAHLSVADQQILLETQTIGLQEQGALPKGKICCYTSSDWSPVGEYVGDRRASPSSASRFAQSGEADCRELTWSVSSPLKTSISLFLSVKQGQPISSFINAVKIK